MKNFQRQERNLYRGGDQIFLDQAGGGSKLPHKNNFENDIDSKVTPEISFLNSSLYSKQFRIINDPAYLK